jgi:uncharacterized protein (TIRG00374 family)
VSIAKISWRVALLIVTGISLYVLFPSLVEVFSSWRTLKTLNWLWALLLVIAEALSFMSLWALQRIAMQRKGWFAIGTSQLTANAVGKIVPGGGATASAFQIGMLARAGVEPGRAGTALASAGALDFAVLLALPVLAVPAILAGVPIGKSLEVAVYLGIAVLILLIATGAVAFLTNRPMAAVGRAAEWLLNKTVRRKKPVRGLPEKLFAEREFVRTTLGSHWAGAVAAAVGISIFDYLALLCAIHAVHQSARPSLVLLSYVASILLSLIPFTPGGLGFVEAGLVGLLTAAGVDAGAAVTATLAYRLVSFWLPMPVGGIAYLLFRHRYPSARTTRAPAPSPPQTPHP